MSEENNGEKKVDHSKDDFAAIWRTLSRIDCADHVERKTVKGVGLKYLSWTWAWSITMSIYPGATFGIREWDDKPWLCDEHAGYLVMTDVTINGNTRTMWLPVMDHGNNAMKNEPYSIKTRNGETRVGAIDMMAINKAIMRCLVKNLALFGLGINIYAGEDIPVGDKLEANADVDF